MTTAAITTHVLDSATGLPAAGIGVRLDVRDGAGWRTIGDGSTDADGRIGTLSPERVDAGTYRLVFATGEWFAGTGRETFYPEVTVSFVIADPGRHHHVPLLLAPFAYSTYRGS